MSKKGTILELRLYDNAIDFINKSMESYIAAAQYPIEYKYAVLFLANGTELILKSLLEDKHPLFIKENLDNDKDKTVGAENLVKRVNKVYQYDDKLIQISNNDSLNFNAIREIRNNIIHKDIVFNEENHPKKLYAETLFSLDRVVRDFKGKTLSTVVKFWDEVVVIEEIRKAYHSNVRGITLGEQSIPCALCSMEKLVKKSDKIKCFHCNHEYGSIEDAIKSLDDDELKEELFDAFQLEKKKDGCTFIDCNICGVFDIAWYDPKKDVIICYECGILEAQICESCKKESVIEHSYELEYGLISTQKFCLNCSSIPDSKLCPACFDEENSESFHRIRIDVKNKSKFEINFSELDFKGSAFIDENVCKECYAKLLRLEEKGFIEMF